LKEYNIDLSEYGTPVVEKSYMTIMEKYASSRIMPDYVNNNTSVVFPLVVE
jgi:hypothetical protein